MKIGADIRNNRLTITIPHNNLVLQTVGFFWNNLLAGLMLGLTLMVNFSAFLGVLVGLFVKLEFKREIKAKPRLEEEKKDD